MSLITKVEAHVVLTCTNGVLPSHLPVIVAATDHEPYCQHVPFNKT